MKWYELSPERLVLESARVRTVNESFTLVWHNGFLCWQGFVHDVPPGVHAEPLEIRIKYPSFFPASSPWVEILSPPIDKDLVGHEWHRLPGGNICYIRDSLWDIATTADEIISKVGDWYFNFLAKRHGLIEELPDVGRAKIG